MRTHTSCECVQHTQCGAVECAIHEDTHNTHNKHRYELRFNLYAQFFGEPPTHTLCPNGVRCLYGSALAHNPVVYYHWQARGSERNRKKIVLNVFKSDDVHNTSNVSLFVQHKYVKMILAVGRKHRKIPCKTKKNDELVVSFIIKYPFVGSTIV